MTFLKFQKELYYISEGIILKNSQKDIRRCEGFQKVLYSASFLMVENYEIFSNFCYSCYLFNNGN